MSSLRNNDPIIQLQQSTQNNPALLTCFFKCTIHCTGKRVTMTATKPTKNAVNYLLNAQKHHAASAK